MPRIRTSETVRSTGAWLLYGGRIRANVPATATFTPSANDTDPLDFIVEMELDIVAGRLACTRLAAHQMDEGQPITSEGLRRVPVAEYVATAAAYGTEILLERIPESDGSHRLAQFAPPPRDFLAAGMSDQALEQVARIYAWAQATGRKATGILLNDYGMPRPTATRWIQTARRRGILSDDHRRIAAGETVD
jgi:hypothetical protein